MNIFSSVQFRKPKKSKFDLSHERKMSMKMGTLTPFLCMEVMPGDSFRVNTEMLMRLQPLIAPMMHRVKVKTDFFFVPNRLVWDNWQKFITAGDKGTDAPVHPFINIGDVNKNILTKGELADFLGLPAVDQTTAWAGSLKVSALPFRAYSLIWDEYYRDQNLQDPSGFNKGDGEMSGAEIDRIMWLRKRAWEKDYFTSALPWAQKGGAVSSPISGEIVAGSLRTGDVRDDGTGNLVSGDLSANTGVLKAGGTTTAYLDVIGEGDIEGAGLDINELRRSVRIQEWLEKNARAGSRYIESILSHFGVLSSDARLQRPEYLGGGQNPIVISEVLSTYQQADDTGYPQGTMSGHGIGTGNIHGFKRSFEEHGFIFGIMTVLPRTAYQQGVPKDFTRFDKFDYAWPSFAQLGEQAVINKELYFDPTDVTGYNEQTFGYQARYAEYKYKPSSVHGDFRDNLAFWHMGRIFANKPALNSSFITADPTKRVFAVETQTEDEILCQLYNRVDAVRPLPYFNSPTL